MGHSKGHSRIRKNSISIQISQAVYRNPLESHSIPSHTVYFNLQRYRTCFGTPHTVFLGLLDLYAVEPVRFSLAHTYNFYQHVPNSMLKARPRLPWLWLRRTYRSSGASFRRFYLKAVE